MFRLFISEILDEVKKAKTVEEKVDVLKKNTSTPLQQILYANFSSKIKFLLPDTPTPYSKSKFPVGLGDNNLIREVKKLYLFIEGGSPALRQSRREQLWIQLLEGMSTQEAELLEELKIKKLENKYDITRECVELAFPSLLEPEEKKTLSEVLVKTAEELGLDLPMNVEVVVPKKKKQRKAKKTQKETTNETPTGNTI